MCSHQQAVSHSWYEKERDEKSIVGKEKPDVPWDNTDTWVQQNVSRLSSEKSTDFTEEAVQAKFRHFGDSGLEVDGEKRQWPGVVRGVCEGKAITSVKELVDHPDKHSTPTGIP
ncbi:hypothetical protein llap_4744 [Limosa lapponica baueri]|uniref:Uncharacterized protein n=1 Tax=Limosa lapponica baueri TaxID=1758121 RepID=A0A2I0UFZ4_LIMLA|nr:hypothetical protein llap_4744 [Limosa lapponica baueri]